MSQDQMSPNKMSAFEEDLLLMNGQQELTASELDAINQVLANNGAVGVIAGYYEQGLPISFASYYFLRSLGYDYTEYKAYDAASDHHLRDLVHEEDREMFEASRFRTVQGRCDFRIVDRDGEPFYANGYKMECTDMDGRLQWILSIRVSAESLDLTLANAAERARDKAQEQTRRIEMESMQALRDACDAANRANEAKTEFLAHMSHDLRTPLNGIIGMTALAGAHIDDKERVLDALDKIGVASRHLLSLVNDLLDMSRIEQGNVTLAEEAFNLSELIGSMVHMIRPEAEGRGHTLEVTVTGLEHEWVIGDSVKIQQMFTNIMGNAIKYTPDGGTLRLTITEKPTNNARIGCYEFLFEDNGIGMSEEFLQVMFDPFSRGADAYVNNTQGTGLGMAITKNIVTMMDGDIKVESTPGQGSRFTVTIFLRLQDGAQAQDAASGERTNAGVGVEASGSEAMRGVTANEALGRMQEQDYSDRRILLVEDNDLNREIAAEMVGMTGAAIEFAVNGLEAVDMFTAVADGYYDMILMDIQMPVMDGYEAVRTIRALPDGKGQEIPIVAMTANAFAEDVIRARDAGFDDHLAKPISITRLHEILQERLAR